MKRRLCIGAVIVSGIAAAGTPPTVQGACLPFGGIGAHLSWEDGEAIVCVRGTPDRCWVVGTGGVVKLRDGWYPSDEEPGQAIVHYLPGVAPEMCTADGCETLSRSRRRIVRALAKDHRAPDGGHTRATTDLSAIVIGAALWNVARDRQLTLSIPGELAAAASGPVSLASLEPIDDLVVATWTTGGSIDRRAGLVTATGKRVGELFPEGMPHVLDDDRFVVVPRDGATELTVIERHRGKLLATLALPPADTIGTAFARIDDETILLLVPDASKGATALVVHLPRDSEPVIDPPLFVFPACR